MYTYLDKAIVPIVFFKTLIRAAWPGSLHFAQQIVSEKSIKSDRGVRLHNIWNHSAHGLVWICNSTPFSPLKSNHSLSITLCSHLGLQTCRIGDVAI